MNLQSKTTTKILIGILSVLLIALGAFTYFFFFKEEPVKTVEVIDFKGMTKDEVEAWVTENEIDETWVRYEYEFDEEIEKDIVIAQSLKETEILSEESHLLITLSDGYDPDLEIELIDFKGMKEEEIAAWFEENKFSDVTFEYLPDDEVETGKFLEINIDGDTAKRSDLILVSISVGTESVGIDIIMPDFSDYTKANINAWAKTNHMTVTFFEETSDTKAEGSVLSQTPKAGQTIQTGGKVSVTLSMGKGITVTDFRGKSKTDAQNWCTKNEIKCTFTDAYSKEAKNTIISQSVTSGTIKKSQSISMTVSIGQVPIENYTGKAYSSFTSYINSLGNNANITVNKQEMEAEGTIGNILYISINGNNIKEKTYVDPGTTVTVTVIKAKQVNVTSYANKSVSELEKFCTDNKLTARKNSEQYSDSVNKDLIIKNDTGKMDEGSTVNYTLSKGKYSVPNDLMAKNASYTALKSEIDNANKLNAGMTLNKTEVESEVTKGNIVGCSVSGKTINCEVSKGMTPKVTVPSFTSNPCGDKKSCVAEGLNINVSKKTDNAAAGTVLSQSIAAGTVVNEGTSIDLVISKGPEACPAGASGNMPNCTCNDPNAEWNGSGCPIVYGTTPDGTVVDIISSTSTSYNDSANRIKSQFANAGFNNVTVVKDVGDVSNPNASNGVITSVSCELGARVRLDTAITIHITALE